MKRFTQLYLALDQTTKTLGKVAAIESYFREASDSDASWAIYFLSGRKIKQLIPTKLLRQWSAEVSGVEPWLFDECYEVVGDLAETMALILPQEATTDVAEKSFEEWVTQLLQLRGCDEITQHEWMIVAWRSLDASQRYVLHKVITGALRVGVSQSLLVRGLAQASGIDAEAISHRLMGEWQPSAGFYRQLIDPDAGETLVSRPYPFFLANALEEAPESLGAIEEWQAEWKWDGIRATLIHRQGEVFIWSRGEELITERFPEIQAAASMLPDGTVLDGEILAWRETRVLPFAELQKRIGRKNLTKRILQEVPVTFMAFDCLELDAKDIREQPLQHRRQALERTVVDCFPDPFDLLIRLSPRLDRENWEALGTERMRCREQGAEGLMLKRIVSPYRSGRPKGDWWKWKIDPYTIDAVLIYAQSGHGKRANLFTDYTFAVWDGDQLVPFAKAYSGLNDAEIRQVDAFVRRNTLERFGPVRSVKAELVFELAFEDIRESSRHKSGIAVRFPRIVRWRVDKTIQEADSLATIRSLIRGTQVPRVRDTDE